MNEIMAEAEDAGRVRESEIIARRGRVGHEAVENLPSHSFPGRRGLSTGDTEEHGGRGDFRRSIGSQNPHPVSADPAETTVGHPQGSEPPQGSGLSGSESRNYEAEDPTVSWLPWEEERERRIYRWRTVRMLRRYMRYSIETGRLPSLLGREFFRTRVTSYSVVTFEDRVIFVHDMETSLSKLDEFSRQIIARHILQEHDQAATARLLQCTERTVRTYVPMALDLLSEILLDVGLMERTFPIREKLVKGVKSTESL